MVSSLKLFRNKNDILFLILTTVLFGYFAFACSPMELGDTHQYLHLFVTREPAYALFTRIFTVIWGYKNYGRALVVAQNIIAIAATYYAYYKFTENIRLPKFGDLIAGGLLLVPHVITPLASSSHMIITNSVMTEGLSFSAYYIWFAYASECLICKEEMKKKSIMCMFGMAFVMTLIRGQFMVMLIMCAMIMIYRHFLKKNYKRILAVVIALGVLFVSKTLITKAYNYANWRIATNTVSSKSMMLANIVYLGNKEAAGMIEDENLKNAYLEMVNGVESAGLTIDYSTGGIISRAKFHESGHETINFDYVAPISRKYITESEGIDESTYMELLVWEEKVTGDIINRVFPKVLGKYISNYFVIASLGFVRSVAVDKSVLSFFAVVMYILAIMMMLYLFRKDGNSQAALFMLMVLIAICGTVFGTSLVIECISRYMIYNLPLFYMALLAMLNEVQMRKDKNEL